ncbi:BnaC04g52680D [Brassica napus]|uniref:(rape) hypothetical protein n=1 Tax=Brassica napus TaxID=3708 RepID=A0A078ILG0_BRANA|nr:unnamed protein product [Brassica napus]CDY50831.1 BnaC04g52680D [Brassica napus]
MYTGEPAWPFADSEDIMPQLLNGNAPEIPQYLPWEARQFLKTCFARNPDERGIAEELLKHPFLRNVSDQKKVSATGVGGKRELVVVMRFKDTRKKPLRVKIFPPKPLQFKKSSHRPLG